ncbi:MAG: methyltransferase domain-containing protein [Deltaproteobacteria bacterium]|nr:methyltransferase domain-containing protein [Deltaproteobacteria bacterium]
MKKKINEYDEVPYVCQAIPNTNPCHLALCSMWAGGPRAPIDSYRVMELGCGDGTNLIALAFYHPNSTFVGVDGSSVQIEMARTCAAALKLSNIRFEDADILELEQYNFSHFDYIIAHGVFSWVPENVRTAIFEFCQQKLSRNGLAYISYNTMPGWAMRGVVRDALLRNKMVRIATVRQKAEVAIDVAHKLREELPDCENAYSALLDSELKRVPECTPSYILHEYLEPYNTPFWFRDFVHRAQSHDLAYIIDAQFCRKEGQSNSASLSEAYGKTNSIEQEERIDVLHQRYFRASILCRKEARQSARQQPLDSTQILHNVFLAAFFTTDSDPFILRDDVPEYLEGESTVMLDESITKAALLILSRNWPHGKSFGELYEESLDFLKQHDCQPKKDALKILEKEILTMFKAGQIEFRLSSYQHHMDTIQGADKMPKATPLAQIESETKDMLTSAYHSSVLLVPHDKEVIQLADGTRSEKEISSIHPEFEQRLQVLRHWGFVK